MASLAIKVKEFVDLIDEGFIYLCVLYFSTMLIYVYVYVCVYEENVFGGF